MKNICLFAIGLVAAVSIGCGGATAPQNADTNANLAPVTAAAQKAAAKDAKGEEMTADEDQQLGIPAGNKGSDVPRQAIPPGTGTPN